MSTDSLDQPIWDALGGAQAGLAQRAGDAARFPVAVTTLAALRTASGRAWVDLAELLGPGERAGLFLDARPALPPVLELVEDVDLLQMVHDGATVETASSDALLELGPSDAPEMVALAEVTRPGPFGPRTLELGRFVGIRDDGRLVAMAGQRLRPAGAIEISAVCTAPSHRGRGLARHLIAAQIAQIAGAGARAGLHVRGDQRSTIELYRRLGFHDRRRFRYVVVRRSEGGAP